MDASPGSWLLCRAGAHLCAVPLVRILEVMRMMPVEPVADAPVFLRGISVIRGAPVAVIDLGRLLGQARTAPTRIITVHIDGRTLGLAVTEVVGVRGEAEVGAHAPVPLLRQAAAESISTIGTLDGEMLLFLDGLQALAESVPA
jgi:purine-binding chemotaxis protein CheW